MNNKLGIYLPLNKNFISLPNAADRPINLNNPFPNSEFSTSDNYVGGNRAIGKSWQNRYNVLIERRTEIRRSCHEGDIYGSGKDRKLFKNSSKE